MDAQRSHKMTLILKKTTTFNYSLVISQSKLIFLSLFRANESIWKCKSYEKMQICVLCLCQEIRLVVNASQSNINFASCFPPHTPEKLYMLFCWMLSALSCNFAILVQNSIVVSAPSDLNLMWHYTCFTFHLQHSNSTFMQVMDIIDHVRHQRIQPASKNDIFMLKCS